MSTDAAEEAAIDLRRLHEAQNAERAVLWAIVRGKVSLPHDLRPEMFVSGLYRRAFEAARALDAQGKPIDEISVGRSANLPEIDRVRMNREMEEGFVAEHFPRYVAVLREYSYRMEVARRGQGIADAALNGIDASGVAEQIADLARLRRPGAAAALGAVDITDALTRADEPIDYCVAPLFARGDKVLIAGEPKIGKSWTALDLAVSLATGGRFLGLLPVAGGPYRVLYVDEENGERLVRYRLRRIARALNLSPEAFANLRYLRGNRLNLDDPACRNALRADAEAHRAEWIILDSLIRFHNGDENDNGAARTFYRDVMNPLASDLGSGIVALHHLAKPQQGSNPQQGKSNLVHRIRGAGDFVAQFDEIMTLERKPEGLLLKHECGRSPTAGSSYHITIEDVDDDGVRLVGQEPEAEQREAIYNAVQTTEHEGLMRQAVVKLLQGAGLVEDLADRQASRHLGQLWKAGRLKKRREGGEGMRYWAAEDAPADAVGVTDTDTRRTGGRT